MKEPQDKKLDELLRTTLTHDPGTDYWDSFWQRLEPNLSKPRLSRWRELSLQLEDRCGRWLSIPVLAASLASLCIAIIGSAVYFNGNSGVKARPAERLAIVNASQAGLFQHASHDLRLFSEVQQSLPRKLNYLTINNGNIDTSLSDQMYAVPESADQKPEERLFFIGIDLAAKHAEKTELVLAHSRIIARAYKRVLSSLNAPQEKNHPSFEATLEITQSDSESITMRISVESSQPPVDQSQLGQRCVLSTSSKLIEKERARLATCKLGEWEYSIIGAYIPIDQLRSGNISIQGA